MRYMSKWNPFLNENVQTAKAFLIKREREKILKENPGKSFREIQLTPEQESNVLQNSDFLNIKDFLQKNNKLGLVYPWVYFLNEDPAIPYGEVSSDASRNPVSLIDITAINLYYVYDYWDRTRGATKLRFGTPEGYVAAKERGELEDTAWNTLWDELQILLQAKKADKFIEFFPKNIRDFYRDILQKKKTDKRSQNLYDKFLSYVLDLEKCPELPGDPIKIRDRDNPEKILHTYPNQAKYHVIKQAGAYNDFKTYPDFQVPLNAFVDLLGAMKRQIEADGKPLAKSINEIENLEPQIKIIYRSDKPHMLVTSVRSFIGIQKICSLSNTTYCIRDLNGFYATQYSPCIVVSINQFDKESSELDYLLTCHLDKQLKIVAWNNSKNTGENPKGTSLDGRKFSKLLEDFKVPHAERIIQAVEMNFDKELSIKRNLEVIYREIGEWSQGNFATQRRLLNLLGRFDVRKASSSKTLDPEQFQQILETVMQIIRVETSFTSQEIIDYYVWTGLFTYQDFKIFIEFLGGDIDKEIIRNVLMESYKKISRRLSESSSKDKHYEIIKTLKAKAEELREKVKVELGIQY